MLAPSLQRQCPMPDAKSCVIVTGEHVDAKRPSLRCSLYHHNSRPQPKSVLRTEREGKNTCAPIVFDCINTKQT